MRELERWLDREISKTVPKTASIDLDGVMATGELCALLRVRSRIMKIETDKMLAKFCEKEAAED